MGVAQLVPEHANDGRPKRIGYSGGCAWVQIRGGFFPDLIEARSGERLRLVFRREETAPCSEQVVIASLGKSVTLPPFEDVPVDLGPLPPGEHEFRCELGVLRGRIIVLDQPDSAGIP
jgi:plastocyanin domain-containing protein